MASNGASISAEDYLERIHGLIEEKGYARPVDIARALNISQPAVTSMVQKLAGQGLLNYEKYRGLTLTEKGRQVAVAIEERHEALRRFLSLIGVSAAAQEQDIEGMEHHLSGETIEALSRLSDLLERSPSLLKKLRA